MADFDPNQPFDVVDDKSQSAQDFDPNKPFEVAAPPQQDVAGTDEWYAKHHPAISTVADTLMNRPGPSGGPGMWTRAGQAVGFPTSKEEVEAAKPSVLDVVGGPPLAAAKMVYGHGQQMLRGDKEGAEEVHQAAENIKAGQPIWPNVGKAAYGMAHSILQSIPFVGAPIETMGEDVAAGNYRGAIGGGLAVVPQIMGAMEGHAGKVETPPTETKPVTNLQRLGEKAVGTLPEKLQPQGISNINRLEALLDKAHKEGKEAIANHEAHAASLDVGEPAPEELRKKADNARAKIAEAEKHLQIAREAQQGVPHAIAPEMNLSPEQKLEQDTRQTPPPTNEELQGRQEKLMSDIEAKAPPYEPRMAPAPRMSEPKVPEVTETPKPEVAPIMTAGKPERAPSMTGLKVTPEGKVEDTTAVQTAAKEALGAEKPARMVPATKGIAVKPGETLAMRGEYPEYTEQTGKRLGVPPPMTEDVGAKVRQEAPPMPRGERRERTRTPEEEQTTRLFKQARTELGENASSDDVMARVDALKAAEAKGVPAREPGLLGTEKEFKAEGRSPEDQRAAEEAVNDLRNQSLQNLGARFGLSTKTEDYDFSKREGENRHTVDRDRFHKDLMGKLPADLVDQLAASAKAWDEANPHTFDQPSRSNKWRADRAEAITKDALTKWEAAGGKAEGAAVGKGYGESNTGVTKDEYQKSLDRLKGQRGSISLKPGESDLPTLNDAYKVGMYHLEAGARTFGDWAQKMRDDLGEAIRPHLEDLWDKIHGASPIPDSSELLEQPEKGVDKSTETQGPKGFPPYEDVAKYHNDNNGFTYNMEKGFIKKDQPGFSVSGKYPDLEKVVPHILKPEDIKDYVEDPKVKDALEDSEKNSVGGWRYKGKSHLDVSTLYSDLGEALQAGKDHDQNAIWDHENGKEIPIGGHAADEAQAKVALTGDQKTMSAGDRAKVQEELAKKGQSGGAPGKAKVAAKLPTGDDLIKKYGESNGDPAQTTFILKDGRGVANQGVDHDVMLGGKATDPNPRREQFIQDGNIRVRPRSGGKAGREVAISIPDTGITADQMKYLKKMGPQLRSGTVLMEGSKAGSKYKVMERGAATDEALEDAVNHITNDAGTHLPTVSGGSGAEDRANKVVENLPPLHDLAEKHLTPEEKLGVSKSEAQFNRFADRMEEMPEVREWKDAALKGAGERKWYQRSRQAIAAMAKEVPAYFDQPGDTEKFTGLLASGSPQQSVAMNMREALKVWTNYVDAGRPEGAALKKLLSQPPAKGGFTLPGVKVPNTMKALAGEPLWPDITKNANFKVPSFRDNLLGFMNLVTNDGWMAAFAGIEAKDISKAHSYHPISVMVRAAADELGWEPAEAQAAVWAFIKTLTEKGKGAAEDPYEMRQYSEDFADILRHDEETKNLLKDMGIDHAKLAERFEREVERKPKPAEVSARTSPTAEDSTERAAERVEKLRGKGAIPASKTGSLFAQLSAEDEGTRFEPAKMKAARMKK